ncbi:Coenzyme F420-reducing hydrogenase, beta subunit [Franzmannia pantelleriensis]|uniref:Coenzyme F420-reducing hydrogenase, beta subunit n=1 Tax=Franzmannia pantelleriensis TaxID=48727 RepID=A0A1G9ECY4_9GAMM|nr:Coenzyme F420 hydrogenase/dehydrogenase, beta subunit C-terminal domain [Halomonas pantelleriensis]SDK74030.1 Coenzyme F420-reducing hydrogenase, beta subunit [Halomonas pantelleriensis]
MEVFSSKVINEDFCIGCGVCAYVNPNKYTISFDDYGMLKARAGSASAVVDDSQYEKLINKVCPFSPEALDEDEIAMSLYEGMNKDKYIGYYQSLYIGYVKSGEFREAGSSGGVGKWLLYSLLSTEVVNKVIQVAYSDKKDLAYEYRIFNGPEDVLLGSKSAYYPVTLEEALSYIKNNKGSYAVTAVPCFSKAIRNLAKHDNIIAERVKVVVGIVCGHLKSKGFAESFAWQQGVAPKNLSNIDFRGKIPGKKANDKGVIVTDRQGKKTSAKSSKELFGGNWGHNLFKYKACDYCDDVLAETADCAIGDAWLPEVMEDHRGNNIVVVRSELLRNVIESGISSGDLELKEISTDQVVKSQLGGIRHRKEGLAWRLAQDESVGQWYPKKRVSPSEKINPDRARIYEARVELREASHIHFLEAKERSDYSYFVKKLSPLIKKVEYRPLWRRAASYIKQKALKVSGK